ncbi:permease [bacterium]|nr:permease [Candidatus Omnitrophota bacterium]MBU2528523.1 permease [bacterium]MBU3929883.1 permease [bacterium]MBU4122375.1 permease [bacterium]
MKERNKFLAIIAVFLAAFFIPFDSPVIRRSALEAFMMLREYARAHVLLCLVPAFFIAGAIANFISQSSVIKYFGAEANKILSYSVAAVSGTILAVCSCTVLPLFAGIYKKGAGIGPATAFLYSGPAINVLAIILTARILGVEMGIARALGAIVFSVIIGLLMHFIFYKDDANRETGGKLNFGQDDQREKPLWKTAVYFAVMVAILIFANWNKAENVGAGQFIYGIKWHITGGLFLLLAFILYGWFKKDELSAWTNSTWGFAKQILPLLMTGVLVAGFLLGRPGHEALIPAKWIVALVGGNSLWANFFAAVSGALMYFATLTEVPILQGLLGAGMGKGPALALLLAGPALSLPNMLVIKSIIGAKKTLVYITLVVVMATLSGMLYGII